MNQSQNDLWNRRYQRGTKMLKAMIEQEVPQAMVENEARLLLNACHSGAWRAIAVQIKHEIERVFYHYAGQRCEWIRTRVLRRTPSMVLEIANRVSEEDLELSKMINEL